MLNKKKKFNKEIVKQVIKIIFLKFELIMILRLFEGKKPKYPYWDELKLTTEKLNILGLPSAKDVKFLESKARGLCREYDKDGISRYKLVPAWQRKDRKKQGLSVYILK